MKISELYKSLTLVFRGYFISISKIRRDSNKFDNKDSKTERFLSN